MSYYDYRVSQTISGEGHPFYALIMCAMRQADSDNLSMLQACWPDVWFELEARYNAPGGLLDHEVEAPA